MSTPNSGSNGDMTPSYPTWYVNLWYSSGKEQARWLQETIEEAKTVDNPEEHLALALRDDVRDNSPLQNQASMYSDLLNWAIGKIDFYELAHLLLEE